MKSNSHLWNKKEKKISPLQKFSQFFWKCVCVYKKRNSRAPFLPCVFSSLGILKIQKKYAKNTLSSFGEPKPNASFCSNNLAKIKELNGCLHCDIIGDCVLHLDIVEQFGGSAIRFRIQLHSKRHISCVQWKFLWHPTVCPKPSYKWVWWPANNLLYNTNLSPSRANPWTNTLGTHPDACAKNSLDCCWWLCWM